MADEARLHALECLLARLRGEPPPSPPAVRGVPAAPVREAGPVRQAVAPARQTAPVLQAPAPDPREQRLGILRGLLARLSGAEG